MLSKFFGRSLARKPIPRRAPVKRFSRLGLEVLEDRTVPSTITATNWSLVDNSNGTVTASVAVVDEFAITDVHAHINNSCTGTTAPVAPQAGQAIGNNGWTLYDDGTNGDVTANDGTWTATFVVETDNDGDCCDSITLTWDNIQVYDANHPPPQHTVVNPNDPHTSITVAHDCDDDNSTSSIVFLEGRKFEDLNGNHVDDSDPGIPDWHITVWLDSNGDGVQVAGETHDIVTGTNGSWSYSENVLDSVLSGPGAQWSASEVQQPDWTQTYGNGGYAGIFVSEETADALDFGNFQNIDICGTKYEDHNGNGAQDKGDQGRAGFTYILNGVSADNIVTNGGFEDPNIGGGFNFYGSIPGWTATSGLIEVQHGVAGTAYTGDQLVELDSNANSSMKQDLATTAGGVYTLTFAYSPRPGVDSGSNGIDVYWNGSLLASITADGTGNLDTVWTLYQFQVTATGATTALEFAATGTSDSVGGYLDAVSVAGVTATSDENGEFCFTNLGPGTYTVTEIVPPGWTQTTPNPDPIIVGGSGQQSGENVEDLSFGNFENVTICATKFYDTNVDGVRDNGESGVGGWGITLTVSSGPFAGTYTEYTDVTGEYCFGDLNHDGYSDLGPGNYTISEGSVSGWVATTPTSQSVVAGGAGVQSGGDSNTNFGNVLLHQAGGLTLGFWSNPNGKAILQANDAFSNPNNWRAKLNALNLRNAAGANFDVSNTGTRTGSDSFTSAFSAFRTWILGASATNMSYMLSAQLAANKLDVCFAGLSSSALIYVPGIYGWGHNGQGSNLLTNLYSCGLWTTTGSFVKLSEVQSNANALLGTNGSILSGNAKRLYAEALKIVLDAVNNSNSNNSNSPGPILVVVGGSWHDNNHNGILDPGEWY